ncbi:MAG: carboxypeptidase regulatory-like domain-containing protein, partial [Candidatus Eremiobacteraeota bacterium]|nr:carboxypeptidase regulatory-like domain-containing protein [Candidatus Eremiobacteraeota bacterium]
MTHAPMKRAILAVLVTLGLVLQATTGVLAGTTGTITGTVVDATTNQPISGAKITAQSPSQTTTTTADANGHYTFLSLNPDTYTLAVAGTTVYD